MAWPAALQVPPTRGAAAAAASPPRFSPHHARLSSQGCYNEMQPKRTFGSTATEKVAEAGLSVVKKAVDVVAGNGMGALGVGVILGVAFLLSNNLKDDSKPVPLNPVNQLIADDDVEHVCTCLACCDTATEFPTEAACL